MPQKDRFRWVAFDSVAWLSDRAVRLMTHEQRGRYIDFIAMTNQGEEPGVHPESEVRAMLCYSEAEWPAVREVYARAFKLLEAKDELLWVQQRTVAEANRAQEMYERFVTRAKAGAAARWGKNASSMLEASLKHSSSMLKERTKEVEESTPTPLSPAKRDDEVDEFFREIFWPAYPRKRGTSKHKALLAMRAIVRAWKGDRDDLATDIMSGLRRDVAEWEGKELQFIPHAVTWLNGRRWET